jgi:hypothetical protein
MAEDNDEFDNLQFSISMTDGGIMLDQRYTQGPQATSEGDLSQMVDAHDPDKRHIKKEHNQRAQPVERGTIQKYKDWARHDYVKDYWAKCETVNL